MNLRLLKPWQISLTRACVVMVLLAALAAAAPAQDESGLPPGDEPPPTVFDRIEGAGTADDHEGADHIIVYDHTVNRVKSTGVTNTDHYVLYKVLTPAGCRNQSVQRWRYEPWSSFLNVREVSIIRSGERIPVDVAGVRELPAPQSGIYWNAAIKTLQLPRLQVGDGIEVRVFRKGYSYALLGGEPSSGRKAPAGDGQDASEAAGAGRDAGPGGAPAPAGETHVPEDDKYVPPMPGEYFDIVLFQASVPIVERRYELSLPADKRLHSRIYNGPLYSSTTYSADSTRYAWWAYDVPARPREPRAAGGSDVVPKVVMATVESWEAKSRWFFDVNEGQFDVTPEIAAKVGEIFDRAGVTDASEERKAEALVHWVAQNIRYSGQTMGEGEGFTLHPGGMIFEQRSGVCKDIAGMLITMMRAAGMDSYAAMTMAGSRIEGVPADQFNHCVTALRKADGSFEMYDPTWVPYMNDIWSKYETEQQYLIGTPEGEGLRTIDYSPPEESPLDIVSEAAIDADGNLRGRFHFSGAAAMDSRLRNMVRGGRKLDVEDDIAALLSHVGPRVEIERLDHVAPDDFSENAWIDVRYRVDGFALPVGEALEFESPMMTLTMSSGWLFRAGAYDWAEDREGDLFLWFTQLIDGKETIRLPRGFEVADTGPSEEVDETYAYFKGDSEMDGGDLVVKERAEVRRRQIPPEGYGGFRRAISEAQDWARTVYRAERGGER
jgi:hypothetical protein